LGQQTLGISTCDFQGANSNCLQLAQQTLGLAFFAFGSSLISEFGAEPGYGRDPDASERGSNRRIRLRDGGTQSSCGEERADDKHLAVRQPGQRSQKDASAARPTGGANCVLAYASNASAPG